MAKPNLAGKLKSLARNVKEDSNSGVKKSGDATQSSDVKKKETTLGSKASGKKN